MKPMEVSCRELVEFLDDYLSRRLPEGRRQAFEAHLADCPDCVRYARSYEQAIRIGRAAALCPEDRPPGEIPPGLVEAILAARDA